jgi:hypothetical protein
MRVNNTVLAAITAALLSTAAQAQQRIPNNNFDASVLVQPTIQAAAYVSGNAIGSLQTVPVFRLVATPSGIMDGWVLRWKGTEVAPVTFYVLDAAPTVGTTCADKTAFVLGAADIPHLVLPPFTLTAAAPAVGTTATSASASFTPISISNKDTPTTTQNLYVCAVSGGSFTPAVGDLSYGISLAQD